MQTSWNAFHNISDITDNTHKVIAAQETVWERHTIQGNQMLELGTQLEIGWGS